MALFQARVRDRSHQGTREKHQHGQTFGKVSDALQSLDSWWASTHAPPILEHADRLQSYAQVKEKMVMLLGARGRLHDPNAMDVGYAGEDSQCWSKSGMENLDIGAVGRGDHCCRCGKAL